MDHGDLANSAALPKVVHLLSTLFEIRRSDGKDVVPDRIVDDLRTSENAPTWNFFGFRQGNVFVSSVSDHKKFQFEIVLFVQSVEARRCLIRVITIIESLQCNLATVYSALTMHRAE